MDKDSFNDIDMAFSKDSVKDRKKWLEVYDPNQTLDYN